MQNNMLHYKILTYLIKNCIHDSKYYSHMALSFNLKTTYMYF